MNWEMFYLICFGVGLALTAVSWPGVSIPICTLGCIAGFISARPTPTGPAAAAFPR